MVTLNRDYVYDGGPLDLKSMFRRHPLTMQANRLQDRIGARVQEMLAMLGGNAAPAIAPGEQCFEPYECPYYSRCTRDLVWPHHGIEELPWLGRELRRQLKDEGIEEIGDIPEQFPLNDLQRVVRRAVRENRAVVHGNVSEALAGLRAPVRYLDFESFAPAIPRLAGTRPCDAVPFLFSEHTERNGLPPEHSDYLHDEDDDPRPQLVDRLIDALGTRGSIRTYSTYEQSVLDALAVAVPERAQEFSAVSARLFDLLPVVRGTYYRPGFRGSFSLKQVLPVLTPEMGYGDLEVTDGRTASVHYMRALRSRESLERQKAFDNLRAYCERDTLALVRLHEALRSL